MKKRIKVLCLLMGVIMLLVSTGCGKENSSTTDQHDASTSQSTTEGQDDSQETVEDPLEEHVNLKWYFIGSWPQPDQDKVFAKLNEITKEKLNATVEYIPLSWGEYSDKMKLIIASGEDYDMSFSTFWANNYVTNSVKGNFLPLNDLLPKYAPNYYAMIPEDYWKAAEIDDKLYGLINYQIVGFTGCLAIYEDVYEEYKSEIDSIGYNELEKLEPVLEKLKATSGDKYTSLFKGWFSGQLEYFGLDCPAGEETVGAVYLEDSLDNIKVFNQFESPEYINYIKLMRDWNQKGYINASAVMNDKENTLVKTGKLPFSIGGTSKPGNAAELSQAFGRPMISKQMSDPYVSTSKITVTMHAINANSKNPERALMFFELLNTDKDFYNLLNWGIEGEHYNKVSDNRIEPIEGSKYNPSIPWALGTTFNSYVLPGQPDDVWEQTKKMNNEAIKSPIIGFTFNAEPVKAEVAKVTAVYNEYKDAFDTGALDIEKEYPRFIERLKAAGSDKLIAEMQKQIDDWKGTK